jgi:hypothetical protein
MRLEYIISNCCFGFLLLVVISVMPRGRLSKTMHSRRTQDMPYNSFKICGDLFTVLSTASATVAGSVSAGSAGASSRYRSRDEDWLERKRLLIPVKRPELLPELRSELRLEF